MTNSHYTFLRDLAPADCIITPNQRLRVYLEKQYNQLQLDQQKTAWPALSIYTLQGLQNQLFSAWKIQQNSCMRLLNSFQAKRLLQDIIQSSAHAQHLFKSQSTSEEVYAAWNLLNQWQLSIDDAEFTSAKEYVVFREWIMLYQQHLKKHQQIDEAGVMQFLCAQELSGFFKTDGQLHVTGFLEYTPLQKYFWQHLGIDVRHHFSCSQAAREKAFFPEIHRDLPIEESYLKDFKPVPQMSKKFEFSSVEEEILVMARWAKQLAKQYPDARIGCIVPKLEPMQDDIKRIFQEVFSEPSAISSQFNISAGQVLYHHAIIQHAVALLKFFIQPFLIAEFKKAMSSKFIGQWQHDKNLRFSFHAALPALNHRTFTLDQLFNLPYFQNQAIFPEIYLQIKNVHQETKEKKKLSYRQWSQWFQHLLHTMGWPGDQSLSSYEYQLVAHWINTIDQLHHFDYQQDEVSLNRFYKTLLSSAQHEVFHPETPDSHIHILGTLEAIALPFDFTWISMMNSDLFPAKIKPNPFIPKTLQKLHHLPHATANRELEYNQTLLSHLQYFSKALIYSYALSDNGQSQQQSGFIRQLEQSKLSDVQLADYSKKVDVVFSSKNVDYFTDEAVPVSADETLTSGTYLFKAQAECGFKAFNELRLQVKPLLPEKPGIEKSTRGRVLHDALENVWRNIQTQSRLKTISPFDLQHLLADAIELAFKKHQLAGFYEKNILDIEKKRHLNLLTRWFEYEKNRDDFSVVAIEEPFTFRLENDTFQFRCDRIDRLHHDDSEIIIDYKNSEYYSLADCFNEIVLHEPQLPLYALSLQDRVNGIAFAQITAKEMKLNGVSAEQQNDFTELRSSRYGKGKSWHQQLQQWKTQLTELLLEFKRGNIIAAPGKGKQTCEICKQQALCRKFE